MSNDKEITQAKNFYENGQFDKFIRRIIKENNNITDDDVYLSTDEHFSKSDRSKLKKLETIFLTIEPDDILKINDPHKPYLTQYIYSDTKGNQYQLNLSHVNETKFILTKLNDEEKYISTKTVFKTKSCQVKIITFKNQSKKISITGDINEGLYFIIDDYAKIK